VNILILTQEDAFYIPKMIDHVIAECDNVVGVGIVPGEMRRGSFRRYWKMMGPRDFVIVCVNLVWHKVMDTISRVIPTSFSYSVYQAACRAQVPVEKVPNVNSVDYVDSLRKRNIDLIVSVACPQILSKRILTVPKHGAINIHGGLLPQYQGLLPSFWVLAKGEKETGVTIHYVDEKIDHGGILAQKRLKIRADDTVHSLVRRSKIEVGKHLLVEVIKSIQAGRAASRKMDHNASTYFSYPDAKAIQEFRSRHRRFI
jgi:methionyl-tRNA formyltransferase